MIIKIWNDINNEILNKRYRFTWRAAAKEDMVSFASVYFSVLGGAYSSLGKYSTSYVCQ